jgi:Family of unknown function (DUF6680)
MDNTIFAIVLGPVIAVIITLWYQNRKEKRDFKHHIFYELMAHRKSFPIPYSYVKALNLIDVGFSKNQKVLTLWHDYYDLLHSDSTEPILTKREHKFLELLSEMANVLGYANLQQVDIDKFYTPIAHGNEFAFSSKLQGELLRVLENTSQFETRQKTDNDGET